MSATRISITQQDELPWVEEYSANEDKASLVVEYTDEFDGWKDRCPAMESGIAEEPGFKLIKVRAAREAGGMVRVTLSYEATALNASFPGKEPGADPVKRYGGDPSLEEVSILAAEAYQSISETEQIALQQIINGEVSKPSGGEWADDVASTEGLECLEKIRGGTTSVYEPSFQWWERFVTDDLSDFELSSIGKIDTPPGSPPSGGSRNYLRLPGSFQMTQDGTAWEMEKRWQLSGKNGWDTDLYDTA